MASENHLELESEISSLSHDDLCEITLSTLRRLVTTDRLLLDLPADVTTDEVTSQIAVAQGQSITVTVLRSSESPLQVVIPQQKSTVYDLKKAIQRCFELKQQRSRSRSKISWKYIWQRYNLRADPDDGDFEDYFGPVMSADHNLVSAHGVRNKSKISFVKRLRNCDNRYTRRRSKRSRSRSVERRRTPERRPRSIERYERRERSLERRERSLERYERRERSLERRERSLERHFRSLETPPEVVKPPEKSYSKADPRLKNVLNS